MKRLELIQYIKNTEQMVLPEKVAAVNQFSKLLEKLPVKLQKRIAVKSAHKNPYMGFIVEPYSFFLAYEITDMKAAQKLLPPEYRIVPTSMFAGTRPRPSVIIGAFNVHTSVFWGSRVELYLIAENTKTGLLSWVIIDYESNTNSYDPGQGFVGASTSKSVVTTSFRGDLIVDVEGAASQHRISLIADIKNGKQTPLDQRLWVEGNLSVDYGGELKDGESDPFALVFDPAEMSNALKIPLENLNIEANTIIGEFTSPEPYETGCFPFAQHFITTNMPVGLGLKNAEDLEQAAIEFS